MLLLPLIAAAAAGLAALLILQKLLFPCFWDDLIYYLKFRRTQLVIKQRMRRGIVTFLDRFVDQAKTIPNKPFIVFEDEVHTYGDVDRRSNKMAQVFLKHEGFKKGDTVAMLMNNEPDFICVWFGLAKLGCAVAFLNSNIRSKSLLHCFKACNAKMLVVGADLTDALENILPALQEDGIQVWVAAKQSCLPGVNSLLDKLEDEPDDPVPPHLLSQINLMSTFLFIFTSGTTGLPKAAYISHLKSVMCLAFYWICGVSSNDIIYLALPLYHMSGSLLGIGGCIEIGATCVLKKKFSASHFWDDCRKYNVTVFQYIGELCRYLVNQPKKDDDRNHKVWFAAGSGLRPDVWRQFCDRFGNIKIFETYGLTEANVNFMNYTYKLGAVGRLCYFTKKIFFSELIKYDLEKGEPVRNEKGRCIRADPDEPGLLIGQVTTSNPFLGYAGSKELSEPKLLRDVFDEGDIYMNTGDMMVCDRDGFVYFRDRIGDTFRWKGENVATTEVDEIIGMMDMFQNVNVYGVAVPGHDGRVGMASLVLKPDQDFDGKKLYEHVCEFLPSYARPRFCRIQDSMEITETFKQLKQRLIKESFDSDSITEPLYFMDCSEKSYVPLTKPMCKDILSGKMRL
ncbi:long-chain fatty acid transport protein 6-like [Protopterus annectens]|uniref:long-chain fatty acid transport protein 6-like n=1 Tax=Protopterus annectens TaxID=7888 RepID=UPI001CF9E245|nr:long-chain fatty acid transport protein 6-like [Protopterus annectens]